MQPISSNALNSNRNLYTIAQKHVGGMDIATPCKKINTSQINKLKKKSKRKRLKPTISPKTEISNESMYLELPIVTESEANNFEHWTDKHKRHKLQQRIVALFLKPFRQNLSLPCKILFTRMSPRELDKYDNLPMSMKYIVDAVCAILTGDYRPGKADSDKRISIAYGQEKNKSYGVRITFTNE